MMTQSFKWPGRVGGSASLCVLSGWAKQTTEFMTSRRHNRQTPYVNTQCHPHPMPGIHQSINQSSKTSIYSVLCLQANQMLHCTGTTHHQRMACHDCLLSIRSSVNNQLSKFKDRLWNNLSFTSLILINRNVCATVLCTITQVHNITSSSYRLVDWIGLWSCLV